MIAVIQGICHQKRMASRDGLTIHGIRPDGLLRGVLLGEPPDHCRSRSLLSRPVSFVALTRLGGGFGLTPTVGRLGLADVITFLELTLIVSPHIALVAARVNQLPFRLFPSSFFCGFGL